MKSKYSIFATLALATHSAHSANIFWADIAGNTNWNTGSSWVAIDPNPPTAPANNLSGDNAIFISVANAQPNLSTGTRSVAGVDFQLPNGGLNFTSAAGATLRLGANGIDASTQLSGDSTVSVENLEINGGSHTWTFFSNDSSASTSTFTVSSNISLAQPLAVRSDRSSAAGNVGIVNLSGDISGSNTLSFSSPSSFSNTINLTGDSSYVGTTTVQQVTVRANSLANSGSNSALGNSGTIVLGNNASAASLVFEGLAADSSTDRLVSIRTTAANGSTLANNDPDHTISFTNVGNTGDAGISTANNTIFILGGSNTGNNTFSQVINDRSGGGVTFLRKSNAGTWVINNSDNTYTGATQVNGGLLRIDNAGALGDGNLVFDGGVLGLAAGNMTRLPGTGDNEVTWAGSGGFAAFGGNRTVSFVSNAGTSINWTATNFIGAGNTLILGHETADSTLIVDQTLSLAGGTRTVRVNDGSAAIDAKFSRAINGGTSGSSNVFNKSGAGTLALTATSNSFHWGNTTVSEGTLMIGDGGTSGGVSQNSPNIIVASGATLAANRSDTLTQGSTKLKVPISGDGGFAQVGSGTTEFTLANIYTGPTTIAAGTLKLNVSGVLPDSSAVTLGSATLNTADGVEETTGTLDVTAAATIDLGSGAALAFADSAAVEWTGGTLNVTGTLGATSLRFGTTSGGLTSEQLGAISVNGAGAGTYTLDANGYLVAGAGASPYVTWASANAPVTGDDPSADEDSDGVSNALEFVLGGTVAANDLGKLPVAAADGTNMTFTFTRDQTSIHASTSPSIEVSDNLVTWNTAPSPYAVPDGAAVANPGVTVVKDTSPGFDTVTLTVPQDSNKKFARFKVVISGF